MLHVGLAPHVVDDATLVLGELVGNAVVHGSPLPDGAIRVEWESRDSAVKIAITDGGGTTVPRPRQPSPLESSGRGLGIVTELAAEWGVTQRSGTSTVWAVVGRQPSARGRSAAG